MTKSGIFIQHFKQLQHVMIINIFLGMCDKSFISMECLVNINAVINKYSNACKVNCLLFLLSYITVVITLYYNTIS